MYFYDNRNRNMAWIKCLERQNIINWNKWRKKHNGLYIIILFKKIGDLGILNAIKAVVVGKTSGWNVLW